MLHKHALQNIIKKVNTHVENGDNYLKSLILSRYLRSFTQIHNQNHSKKNPTEPFLQQQYGKFSWKRKCTYFSVLFSANNIHKKNSRESYI